MSFQLGFLGAGQMATALASGALSNHLLEPKALYFSDPSSVQRKLASDRFEGCTAFAEASDLFAACDTIVLSVKPQVLAAIGSTLAKYIKPSHTVISIAAGVTLSQLQAWLATKNVVRVMPNTPAQVSAGISALASDLSESSEGFLAAKSLFETVGEIVVVNDSQMDAVTGLSGSGPAYVLMMLEAMSDAGVAAGLPRAVATQLANQTVMGTAVMAAKTKTHPALLKEQVTSPAGTTVAGLRVLESKGFRSAIIEAILQATERSRELRG